MLDLLRKIMWDYQLTDDELLAIYRGKISIGGMNEVKLKARLLNSYNWYTLIKVLGLHEAKSLLKPDIIKFLFPKLLQQKYQYAAEILLR